jgi:hypothetical protein
MYKGRRDFLSSSLPGFAIPLTGEAWPPQTPGQNDSFTDVADPEVLKFWETRVREPAQISKGTDRFVVRGRSHDPAGQFPAPGRTPEFIFYTSRKNFRSSTELEDKDLLEKGDVSVTFQVRALKPSDQDRQEFEGLRSGSLRVDFQQAQPLPGLPDVLAWSTVAALFPNREGKLPRLSELKFDPGTAWGRLHSIPLPSGSGFWTWNFFLQKKDSLLTRFMIFFRKANELLVPVLGLPSVAVTALRQFDRVFGYLQAQAPSRWLFNTADLQVVCTRETRQNSLASALPLCSGIYVIVPREHLSNFGAAIKNETYVVKKGLIVPEKTSEFQVYDAASEVLRDVTYLTIDLAVRQIK